MVDLGVLRTRLGALLAAVVLFVALSFTGAQYADAASKNQSNTGNQQKQQSCKQNGSGKQSCKQSSKQSRR